jgi:glycerol-3-phosphate O-acyltransferase
MALGKQYHLQGLIKHAESVSTVLFDASLRLAANRKLVAPAGDDTPPDAVPDPALVDRRLAFAAELHEVLRRLDGIEALAAAAAAGVLE